jgi:hypothetical protein
MLDHITPYDALLQEAAEIQSYCEVTVSDNPNEIAERIGTLCVYIARTGNMLAEAKYHLSTKRKDETLQLIAKILDKKLSAKVQNSMVESICKDEQYLVDCVERLNKTATHQLEAMRSLLSYEKENLRISKTGY